MTRLEFVLRELGQLYEMNRVIRRYRIPPEKGSGTRRAEAAASEPTRFDIKPKHP